MAKEETKDFNAMLHRDTDMPKIQIITDPAVIQKYGGEKMYFAPPLVYDEIMRSVPRGKLLTVGHIRAHYTYIYWRTLPTPSQRGSSFPWQPGPATSGRRTKRPTGGR